MQDAFPIRAGGPGWFSYRPGYSSAGQNRLMRMESTAIFAAGFPGFSAGHSSGRSSLSVAAGSFNPSILDGDRTSAPAWGFLLLTPRAGLTPAAATVPVTPCPSHVTQAEETPALPEHS